MKVHPYLNFPGTCAEAFRFYEQLFGGTIEMMQTFGEAPMPGHDAADTRDLIIHARLALPGGAVILASDAPGNRYQRPQGSYVSLHVTSADEGKRIYDALADGGQIHMPFQATYWTPGFGMLADKYGVPWMVNVDPQS